MPPAFANATPSFVGSRASSDRPACSPALGGVIVGPGGGATGGLPPRRVADTRSALAGAGGFPYLPAIMHLEPDFDAVAASLRACRICRDAPLYGPPLPQEPRPIVQGSTHARLCIASQAPGNRADRSGIPFMDPSGVRLRDWLGLDEAAFYDASRLAIVPMGACFPGYDAKGGDRPPRRECAERWRAELFAGLPHLDLILVIGQYAQAWHLGRAKGGLTETVRGWRAVLDAPRRPRVLPLPHPSWRNSGWLKANPWFEAELLPVLRAEVATAMR